MAPNSTFLEATGLFWAKIREDLANFSGIYGCLAARKVNLIADSKGDFGSRKMKDNLL
jgi:hypothetical protein